MGERFPAPHPLLLWTPQALQSARGAALSLYPAEKSPRNPLFSEEHPWEARFDNLYANVLLEQGQYRCWYSPFLTDEASRTPVSKRRGMRYFSAGRRMGVCYAQSADGLNWVKPGLGLVDFEGSRANNIVLDGAHGAGILRDELEPDPSRRYKAIFSHDPDRGMSVAWSPDGLRWSAPERVAWPCRARDNDRLTFKGDTHNHLYRDPESGRYVLITRGYDTERVVARSESEDLRAWSEPEVALRGAGRRDQIYAMPVFPYAGGLVGLPCVFDAERDTVHGELAYSPDGRAWTRICPGKALLPLGQGLEDYPDGDCDCGCIFPAVSPVALADSLRVYYGGSNGRHTQMREGYFCLAAFPRDGLAGYRADGAGGEALLVTRPLPVRGALALRAALRRGDIRAALEDPEGRRIPGYGWEDFDGVQGPALTWKGSDTAALAGRTVRLALRLLGDAWAFSVAQRS